MKRGSLKLWCLAIIIALNSTQIYAQEKSDKLLLDFAISEKIHKKHQLTFTEAREINLKLFECRQDNSNHRQLIKDGKKVLYLYTDLILDRKLVWDKKDFVETINKLSWCYYHLNDEKKFFIKLVRASLDDNILNANLLFNSYSPWEWEKDEKININHSSIWMFYSRFLEETKETAEISWPYDEKIIKILISDPEKKTNDLGIFLNYSETRLTKKPYIKKVINLIKPFIYESNFNGSNFSSYTTADTYFSYLHTANDYLECKNFFKEKVEKMNFSYENIIRKIRLIDDYLQCQMVARDWIETSKYMLLKAEIIEDALKNFDYDKVIEGELYNHYVRALNAVGEGYRVTGYTEEGAKKKNFYVSKAQKINEEYFSKKNPFDYLGLNVLFIANDINELNFEVAEKKINAALLKIENLKFHDFPESLNFSLERNIEYFKVEKVKLRARYLDLLGGIFTQTKRYKQAINVYENLVKANQDVLKSGERTYSIDLLISGPQSLEVLWIVGAYLDLFKIYNVTFDLKNQKKYIRLLDKICFAESLSSVYCADYHTEKIKYYVQQGDIKGLQEASLAQANEYAKWSTNNPFLQFVQKGELLQNKVSIYIEQEKKLLKNKSKIDSLEHNKIKNAMCETIDELINHTNKMDTIVQDVKTNKEYKQRMFHVKFGTFFMKLGAQCNINQDFANQAGEFIDVLIEQEKNKINQWLKIPSEFYKYELKSDILNDFAAAVSFLRDEHPKGKKLYTERLKKIFEISQFGKNLYLTKSIKTSIGQESIEDEELKQLITQRNLLEKKLEQHTKNIFENPNLLNNNFQVQKNIKNKITNLSKKIVKKFPKFNEEIKIKFYKVEEVQKKLEENEALIVYDSHNFYFAHIITKDKYDSFVTIGMNMGKIRDAVHSYRKDLNPKYNKNYKQLQKTLSLGYEAFFRKIEKRLNNVNKLVFVTDKYTEDFPIGVLYDIKEKRYLAEKYSISYHPSVGSLVELRSVKKKQNITIASNFLGIGDPTLGKKSLGNYIASISDFSFTSRGILKDSSILEKKFTNLPFSKDEIKNLAKLFNTKTILLSKEANEKNVKSLNLNQFNVIAFATHASVSGALDGFNEPFLVLTPPKTATKLNDGILTASEISQLNLNANIVILSACNTASRDNEYAPGFSGLVAAFFKAGTKTVLATHWPVADKASSIMINETIKKSVDKKMNFSQSLQETKRDFIKGKYGEKYKNPIYWASYVIIGD